MSEGQLTPEIQNKMLFTPKCNFLNYIKKNTRQMRANIFHHRAECNAIYYFKFDMLEFLDAEKFHKKFGSNILKNCRFFLYCLTFGCHFLFWITLKNK